MKKILLYAAMVSVLASCDIWNDGERETYVPAEPDPAVSWRGPMYFYYLDGEGRDLLDFNAGEIQYPVHYPTHYMQEYRAPDKFTDIVNYGVVTGRYYSGNWSTITRDDEIGLYKLHMNMPFSNLSKESETFYVARSESDVDTITAEIEFLTEGVIGGGPDSRYPDVQKLWYNGVLIMDKSSKGDQRTFVVKHSDGTTSVHPKTRPSPDK